MRATKARRVACLAILGLAALVLVSPAAAQQIAFTPAGFSLSVPAGYSIRTHSDPFPADAASFTVTLKDQDYLYCSVGFHRRRPDGVEPWRANYETIVKSPDGGEYFLVEFHDQYDIKSIERIEYNGVRGLALVGDIRFPVARMSVLGNLRELRAVLANAFGYADVKCATEESDFIRRRPQFEVVLRGISFPKASPLEATIR